MTDLLKGGIEERGRGAGEGRDRGGGIGGREEKEGGGGIGSGRRREGVTGIWNKQAIRYSNIYLL